MTDRLLDFRHARHLFVALFVVLALAMAMAPSAANAANAANAAEQPPGLAKKLATPHADDRVIVKYESNATKARRASSVASVEVASVETVSPLATDTYVVELKAGQSVEDAIVEISTQPGVAYVEPAYYVFPAVISDDARSDEQWGMQGDATSPSNQFGTGAAEAWALGAVGDSSVYVAVLDQGIDTGHEDLVPNLDIAHSWDFLNDDPVVYDNPADWHGTHVAGIIGARGGNNVGVAGVNWRVKIISAKMLGTEALTETSEVAAAIDHVVALKNSGLDIVAINASWGYWGTPDSTLRAAVQRAGDAGLLFVAAAGNNGNDIDPPGPRYYPAAYECPTTYGGAAWDCVISVANLTSTGELSSSSNYGSASVDLGAPGTDILSTTPEGYDYADGTSMAAPHVAGAAALCASIVPSLSASQIRSRIMASAAPTSSMAGKTVTGGRLDVGALALACRDKEPVTVPPPVATPTPAPPTIVVDERSPWFTRRGDGWKRAVGGYKNRYLWTPTQAGSAARSGRWRPDLPVTGAYRVEVKIAPRHATTRKAVYKVRTTSGWVERVRNQRTSRGRWISLGVHQLTTRPVVLLTDKTGERSSLRRRVSFDAVRFTPLALDEASIATVDPPVAAAAPETQPEPALSSESPSPPESASAEPQLERQPEPEPEATPEPTVTPAPDSTPARAKPAADVPAAESTPDEPPEPDLVLIIDPERIVLTVGESRPIGAYVCQKGAASPGPDKGYGTADDGCTAAKDVEWSLKDPTVAGFAATEGKRTRLSATLAVDQTKVTAAVGDLTAKADLTIKPQPAPEPAATSEAPTSLPPPAGEAPGSNDARPASEREHEAGAAADAQAAPEPAGPAATPPSEEPAAEASATDAPAN